MMDSQPAIAGDPNLTPGNWEEVISILFSSPIQCHVTHLGWAEAPENSVMHPIYPKRLRGEPMRHCTVPG
jgi:hypothetical protein